MMRIEDDRLIEALSKNGLMSKTAFEQFRIMEKSICQDSIVDYLITTLNINEQDIAKVIAEEFNVPLFPTVEGQAWLEKKKGMEIDAFLKNKIIPLTSINNELTVAFYNPPYSKLIELIAKILKQFVVPVIITYSDFTKFVKIIEKKIVTVKVGTTIANPQRSQSKVSDAMQRFSKWNTLSQSGENPDAHKLIVDILEVAFDLLVTDIHFESNTGGLLDIRFRIDGDLRKMAVLPQSYSKAFSALLKQSGSAKNIVKEGTTTFTIRGQNVDVRFCILPSNRAENITIHILSKKLQLLKLNEIGLYQTDLHSIRQMISQPNEIILFAGPTGCGKTTTMYSALNELINDSRKIVAFENPIEYLVDGIQQISFVESPESTFSDMIHAIFRHDVDILCVGEIAAKEEQELLLEAGLTGITGFATIQAWDAIKALKRLQSLGAKNEDIAMVIRGIVAQRFVRAICKNCAQPFRPDKRLLELAGLSKLQDDFTFMKGKGCVECNNTGSSARLPLFEILVMNEELRRKCSLGSSYEDLKNTAVASGFTSIRYDGLRKAFAGIITLEEVLRVS